MPVGAAEVAWTPRGYRRGAGSMRVRVPDNPSAWVHRIAKNKILDALRRDKIGRRVRGEWAAARPTHEAGFDHEIIDRRLARCV